ncbi:MAG: methyl-accepting chemotaxis protein [Candidatus Hodarchaeales archaeon]
MVTFVDIIIEAIPLLVVALVSVVGVLIVSYWRFRTGLVTSLLFVILSLAMYGALAGFRLGYLQAAAPELFWPFLALLAGVGIILIVLIGLFLYKRVIVPMHRFTREFGLITEGHIDVPDFADIDRRDEIGEQQRSIVRMTTSLQEIVKTIRDAAEKLTTTTEEFVSSTEEVKASSEEISSVIQQMNRGAQQQAEQINDTVTYVQDLSNISEKIIQDISNTVGLISDVASQTNMLSLNAQIEAARAGDFGKSFMVVADNVRRLAEDTKSSTVSIQTLVDDIQQQITSNVDRIAKSVDSVAAVAEETAASSEEASSATEQQTATMEEMSAVAQELAQLAEEMTSSISTFKIEKEEVARSAVVKIDVEKKNST